MFVGLGYVEGWLELNEDCMRRLWGKLHMTRQVHPWHGYCFPQYVQDMETVKEIAMAGNYCIKLEKTVGNMVNIYNPRT